MQITDGLLVGNYWIGLQALSLWGIAIHMHPCMYVYMYICVKYTTNKWGKEGICIAATGTAEFCGILPSTFIEINAFSVHSNSLGSSR